MKFYFKKKDYLVKFNLIDSAIIFTLCTKSRFDQNNCENCSDCGNMCIWGNIGAFSVFILLIQLIISFNVNFWGYKYEFDNFSQGLSNFTMEMLNRYLNMILPGVLLFKCIYKQFRYY